MARKLTREEFIERARKVHGDKYDYDNVFYQGFDITVNIGCQKHGLFKQTPHKHLMGQGCPLCNGKFKKTFEQFVTDMQKIHGERYDYSKAHYKNNKTEVIIICPIHGEFKQRPDAHLQGQGCPHCPNNSRLEEQVKQELNKRKINYYSQYNWEWLKYKKSLRVDFYLPDYNIAIECQGRQHFIKHNFFNTKTTFEEKINIDITKYNLCKQNNIKVLYLTNVIECKDKNMINSVIFHNIYNENTLFFTIEDLFNNF